MLGGGPTLLIRGNFGPPPEEATVLAEIEKHWTGAVVVRARAPGERHPRMWRGRFSEPLPDEEESLAGALTSANVLLDRFRHVLRTVEPDPANRSAFGHELRQLLILACTEVESAWKSILVANKYPQRKNDRFITNDYCNLCPVLKLEEWEVELAMFPRYGTVAPFRGWDAEKPTESLSWYADYNRTKHDREINLRKATLENLISSMAGLYIMLAAQAGTEWLSRPPFAISDFRPRRQPHWDLADEYVPTIGPSITVPGSTKLVPYPF